MPVVLLRLWTGFIWPLLKLSIPVPLFLVLAIFVWWQVDKTSSIRTAVDEAVESYTHTVELTAANAQIEELKRQVNAASEASAWLRIRIAQNEANEAARKLQEKKDADYIDGLAAAGRAWYLDDNDINWLRDGR